MSKNNGPSGRGGAGVAAREGEGGMDVRRRFVELTRFLLGLQESLELSEIFQRCYDGLPACLDVSRVTIMLYDEALGGLVSDQYLGVKHRGEKIVSSIQPVGAYLSGRCFAECRPIAIDDCSVTDLIPARDVGNLKLKSCISVPLMTRGRCIGVLRLDYTDVPHHFTREDIEQFSLVADQLGAVIENARLVRQLRATEDQLASSVSLLTATLEATADGILVFDDTGRIVGSNRRLTEMWRIPDEVARSRNQERILDAVALQLRDAERSMPRGGAPPADPEADSFDILELRDGRVFERHSRPQRLADKVIGRVVSFRDITEQSRETRTRLVLSHFAAALAGAHTLSRVGDIVCATTADIWGWDAFFFTVLEQRGQRLRQLIECDTIDGVRQRVPERSDDPTGFRALESLIRGRPYLVNRSEDDQGPPMRRFGDVSRPSASLMICPVRVADKVVAMVSVQSYAPFRFNDSDLLLLGRMADTVGPVIERCWAEERSVAFSSLGKGLSAASSPREAAQLILKVADDLLGWDCCYLDLYFAEEDTSCSVIAMDTIDGNKVEVSPSDEGDELSPMGCVVLEKGAQLLLRNAAVPFELRMDAFGDKSRESASLMFVPSRIGSRVIGILSIQSYTDNAYDETDLATLQALADHCSGALVRTRIESEHAQLAAAVESSGETVIVTDRNHVIRYVNASFEKVTGYKKSEAIGCNVRKLLGGTREDDAFYAETDAVLERGEIWHGHFHDRKKDGTEYEEDATISPIRGASGQVIGYVTVKRDVTEQMALEEQLRHAQRMEAVGRLAGGIAHDFNNLLQAIVGYSQLLLAALDADDPRRSEVEEIEKAADRGASLTRQLLAYSRKQVLQPQRVDVNVLVADLEKMLHRLIREDIELVTILGPGASEVHVDPGQLEQVIINLVVNARDALPRGGRITIRTSRIALAQPLTTHLETVQPGAYVVIMVKDNGVGMDAESVERIFEPFFTTKEVGKGTGLGLSTVYGVVKQSGGFISVQSEPGKGSSFEVFLPATDIQAAPRTEDARSWRPDERGREHLLVVEDEEIIRLLACRILQGQDYDVLSARDGYEALEVVAGAKHPVDLLVTDVVMPRMGGPELARRMKDLYPPIQVLFISGHADSALMPSELEREGTHFISKPFKPHELTHRVREILDRSKGGRGRDG